MRKRIGLVTCRVLPEPDPDQTLQLNALRDAGMDAELIAWDDDQASPDNFDACVLRSTWNYYENATAFREWLKRADRVTLLLNPLPTLLWNLHKSYLGRLTEAGIPTIPTRFIAKGQSVTLADVLGAQGWSDVVIKPAISAGSNRTQRFTADALHAGERFAADLATDGDVMVQPYMTSIETSGERALVWIDGEWMHAVNKSPRFSGGDEQVKLDGPLTDEECVFAERARKLAPNHDLLLYARVDVIRDAAGALCVSEVELLEPSLFFLQHPPALERFVAGIQKRVQS